MIAIDTSALMAVLLDEAEADACAAMLEGTETLLISVATVAEALIVAGRRGLGAEMASLIDGLGLETVNVTPASARRVAEAYGRWGKGVHAAALNFEDCFAYDVARTRDCPLLFVGEDFSRRDLTSAIEIQASANG